MSGSVNALIANPQAAQPINWQQVYGALQQYKDLQAQQAQAQAYQQAINPLTGQLDQGQYNALLAGTPQGAWGGTRAMQQAGAGVGAQAGAQNTQTAGQIARRTYVQGQMTDLLQNPNATMDDVINRIHQVANAGILLPDEANAIAQQAQSFNGPAHDFILNQSVANQAATEQLRSQLGSVEGFDTPSGRQFRSIPPTVQTSGAVTGGAPGASLTVPSIQMVTPMDIRMSDNSTQQVLPANVPAFLDQHPGATVIGPSQSGQVPVGAGGQPTQGGLGTGRYPAPTPPSAPTTAPPVPVVGPPPQPVAGRSAPMGAPEAAVAAVGQGTAVSVAAGGSPQRQAILSDMAASLSGSTPLSTGFGSNWGAQWSNAVNRYLPDQLASLVPGMSKEQVASQEGFNKMAEQLRQLQSSQLSGAITNDKFASALASSPHAALSTLGNLGMIHILQGNEDAITAKNQAWQQAQQQGWQAQQFANWQSQYNATPTADPRVYWLQHMSPEERKKFVDGLSASSPAQLALLKRNFNWVASQPPGS